MFSDAPPVFWLVGGDISPIPAVVYVGVGDPQPWVVGVGSLVSGDSISEFAAVLFNLSVGQSSCRSRCGLAVFRLRLEQINVPPEQLPADHSDFVADELGVGVFAAVPHFGSHQEAWEKKRGVSKPCTKLEHTTCVP